jgi:polyhydroxyalkanoate synthesis regulator phasin
LTGADATRYGGPPAWNRQVTNEGTTGGEMPANVKNPRVPEFLREPLESAQQRLEAFEEEAQKVFKDLVQKGRASRKDFATLVQRLSKQDWNTELRGRFGKLRAQGKVRATQWRGKAESFRADAMDTLEDLQSKAIEFLGVASREQVEELARELEKLVKRLDRSDKPAAVKKGKARGAKRAEG